MDVQIKLGSQESIPLEVTPRLSQGGASQQGVNKPYKLESPYAQYKPETQKINSNSKIPSCIFKGYFR